MAAYEAIRDSFREFNRTLIDSQAWNAQHEVSMADRQLKQTMLLNQLNQQKFSNRMEEERVGLIRAGNRQGADRLEEQIRNNDLINTRTTQRDTNNYNYQQSMLNKTAAKNRMDSNYQQAVLKGQAETRIEAKETADLNQQQLTLQNEELERTAAIAKEGLVPSRVIIPPSVVNNPKAFDVLKDEVLTRWGGSVDENNVVRGRDDNELMIPKHEQYKLNFKVKALEAVYDNKPKLVTDELSVLSRSKNKLQSSIGSKKSIYDKTEVAAMKRQANVIDAEIQKRSNYLSKLETIEGQAQFKIDQAKNIRVAANNLNSTQKGDDPGSAKSFLDIADSLEAEAKALLLTKDGGTTGASGIISEPVVKNGEVVGRATYNKVNRTWGFRGGTYGSPEEFPEGYSLKQEGETGDKTAFTRGKKLAEEIMQPGTTAFTNLSGDAKSAISTHWTNVSKQMKLQDLDPTEANFNAVAAAEKKNMMEAHDIYAAMYEKESNTRNVKDFNEWVRTEYKSMLEADGFEYIPKQPYILQIGESSY